MVTNEYKTVAHAMKLKTCCVCSSRMLWEINTQGSMVIATSSCCGHYYQIREENGTADQKKTKFRFKTFLTYLFFGIIVGFFVLPEQFT